MNLTLETTMKRLAAVLALTALLLVLAPPTPTAEAGFWPCWDCRGHVWELPDGSVETLYFCLLLGGAGGQWCAEAPDGSQCVLVFANSCDGSERPIY